VKVIRLIRDGRAVALTYMNPADYADAKDPGRRGGGSGGKREDEKLSVAQAAHEWRRSMEESEHALRRLKGPQWTEVRYEELCGDTDATLDRIFTFLGLDPNKRCGDFRSVENHIIGNGMRLDSTSQISLDERWRSKLTKEDMKAFDREAGDLNRRYGYN